MKSFKVFLIVLSIVLAVSCGKGMDLGSTAIQEEATLSLVGAKISNSTAIETHDGGTRYSLAVKSSSNEIDKCDPTLGSGARLDDATSKFIAVPYTPTSTQQVSSVVVRLIKNGLVSGDIYMEIRSDSSGVPSSTILTSSPSQAVANAFFTFTFNSSVNLTSGTKYHFVLRGDSNYNGNVAGLRWMRWYHDINDECVSGNFGDALGTTDAGSTWADEANSANKTLYIVVYSNIFANDGPTVSTNYNALVPVEWDLSTFTSKENPGGERGSILYDVGASTSDSDAQYQVTGATLSELQASGFLYGEVLHVRASLQAGAGLVDAGIGEMGIEYYR